MKMTLFWKVGAPATCVVMICGGAILWKVHREKATEQKLLEATSMIRVRAESGDADAQFSLGNRYRMGEGVPRDYAESVRWLRKASYQGDAKAENSLGFMSYYGQGVPQNYPEAVRWYRKAADQNYERGQFNLALMYYEGKGVPRDYAEAARWFRKAAEQGYSMAQSALGFNYTQGHGVPQDYAEAFRWYRKAAEQGDADAQYTVGFMSYRGQGVPRNYAESAQWYLKAADQGDEKAQMVLGNLYRKGQGVPRNYAEAVRWYGRGVGKIAAACFAAQGSAAGWAGISGIVLGVVILAVPDRRWGRSTWVPSAVVSGCFTVMLAHELLLSPPYARMLSQRMLGALHTGFGSFLFIVFLAGGSAIFALSAVRAFVRGSLSREALPASLANLSPARLPAPQPDQTR
jgi:TPR repeat protein